MDKSVPNGAGIPAASAWSKPRRGGNKKITRNLIALGATAILAVYGIGYVNTQSAAAQVAAQSSQVATSTTAAATGALATASAQPTAAATATTTATTSQYKDGTYTGSGSSRHGGVSAQVVVQNGKIVSAAITQTSTRYPASAIASLPPEVVNAQSTNVDTVSGATDSSDAYLQAVDNALHQALA